MISKILPKNNEEKPFFRLFILKNDENQNVMVQEVDKIDYSEVEQRVEQGDSIFITRGRKEKVETNFVQGDKKAELFYLPHI